MNGDYNQPMRAITIARTVGTLAALLMATMATMVTMVSPVMRAQQPAAPPTTAAQTPAKPDQTPVIRRAFDIITTDVIVRDGGGQFIADLKKGDFEIYEDGVKQDVVSFILTHGGRVFGSDGSPQVIPRMRIVMQVQKHPDAGNRGLAVRVFKLLVDTRCEQHRTRRIE